MRLRDDPDRSWEQYGKEDPYYGVLTSDEFRRGRMEEAARAAFFASGREHVDRVLAAVRSQIDAAFAPRRALDFGCGVGRLVIPLSNVCDEVTGVDVSEHMLEEARRNCDAAGATRARLVRSDDGLSRVEGPFDFVHSFIVFQHIPPRRGERIFTRILELLEPGGVGAIHVTFCRRSSSLRRAVGWARANLPLVNGVVNRLVLRQPFGRPLMQMNEYDLGKLFRVLIENDCHRIIAEQSRQTSGPTTSTGLMLLFKKQPLPSW